MYICMDDYLYKEFLYLVQIIKRNIIMVSPYCNVNSQRDYGKQIIDVSAEQVRLSE